MMRIQPIRYGVNLNGDDPYASFVTNLLHFNGANGSTTFVDEAGPTWSLFGTGNRISTAENKFGVSSLQNDGIGNSTTRIQSSNSILLGSQDFCLEAFYSISPSYNNAFPNRFVAGLAGARATRRIEIMHNQNGQPLVTPGGRFIARYSPNESLDIPTTEPISKQVFYHLAMFRAGNTLYFTVDGAVIGTKDVTGVSITNSSALCVGTNTNGDYYQAFGWIDEVRMTVGHSRYTGAFTPPSAEFPNP